MNYQTMWEWLQKELLCLAREGVETINPHLILGYMRFIQEIEEQRKDEGQAKKRKEALYNV